LLFGAVLPRVADIVRIIKTEGMGPGVRP